jgi:L-lysine epsilon oxidase-like protein
VAKRTFRIHPSIGVARAGNADRNDPGCFFIGPETPGMPANWDPGAKKFLSFKLNGKIKAQAARFRVWEYVEKNGKMVPKRELNLGIPEVVSIAWTVHLANRKASFFKFDGRKGEADNYASLTTNDRRNNAVPEAKRFATLEIDEGPKSIQGKNAPKVEFKNSKKAIPIETLGELRTDDQGRLLVLGGKGQSSSSAKPPVKIDNYANNDTWFDDVSDGPVTAVLTLKNAAGATERVPVEGAWVTVGPPDFAPAIGNVVTLYDTLWDLAVRELKIPSDNALYDEYEPGKGLRLLREQNTEWAANKTLTNYTPSFTGEIFPIFTRAFSTRWVHEPLNAMPVPSQHHDRIADSRAQQLAELPGNPILRKSIFNRLRNRDSPNVNAQAMPKAFGDDYNPSAPVPTSYLSLTRTQGALMKLWMTGKFVSDWAGIPPKPPKENITPEGLDRAALENSVGGAFFPGIEVSWLIRKKDLFSEPFRIKHGAKLGSLTVGAGFFSQQMALPWQADFWACAKEPFGGDATGTTFHAWWPAQRPDDVFKRGTTNSMIEWARGIEQYEEMVKGWSTRGHVIEEGGEFFEKDGPA